MLHRSWFWLSITLLGVLGCGDDDGSSPESSRAASSCTAICAGMARANCGGDLSRCETLCQQQYKETHAACRATADRLLDCASKATYSCGAEGPVATFCAPLEADYDRCEGVPDSDAQRPTGNTQVPDAASSQQDAASDAGTQPTDASVVSPTQPDASVATPDASASTPDATVAMPDASATTPDASSADAGPSDAGQVVSCELSPNDLTCDRCLKTSCCAEAQACGPACQLLADCVATCFDTSCAQYCYNAYYAGAAQFDTVLACSNQRCAEACRD